MPQKLPHSAMRLPVIALTALIYLSCYISVSYVGAPNATTQVITSTESDQKLLPSSFSHTPWKMLPMEKMKHRMSHLL